MAKDSGQGGVDPRFDRRFQRGFDGPVAPVTPTAPPSRQVELEPEPEPLAPIVASPAASAPVVSAPDLHDFDDRPLPRFNPFRLGLLVASLACILLSAWLSWQSIDNLLFQYGGGTNPWMRFLAQLNGTLTVPLLTAGLIGVVLWLAVGAVAPRRVREHE